MKKGIFVFGVSVIAVAVVLAAGAVAPRSAVAAPSKTSIVKAVSYGTAMNVSVAGNTSENWSGYVAPGSGYTSVGAAWVVPTATASTSLAADATWVGIGGVSSTDLIQAGTQAVIENGTTTYEAWYELLPAASQEVPLSVHPGDMVSVSITAQSGGTWLISFADFSDNTVYTTTVAYSSSGSSAEWIEEMPSDDAGVVPIDNFGSVSFSQGFAAQNGERMTLDQAGAQPITMITLSGSVLAAPGALGSDGASFTVTRTDIAADSGAISSGDRRRGPWSRTGVGVQGYTPPVSQRQPQDPSVPSFGAGRSFRGFHFGFGGNLRNMFRFGFHR